MTVLMGRNGRIAIVTIDNAPVNALRQSVRETLITFARVLDIDPSVDAVVLTGAGKLFVGGADITEFDHPPEAPLLPEVIAVIEGAAKPWIAAIHGVALGGGLELALGCRFRVAAPDATLGLPEINLGIIPGAGGTQRLPRLIGTEAAVSVAAEKVMLDAPRAVALGLVECIVDGPLVEGAVAFARDSLTRALPLPASAREAAAIDWDAADARIRKQSKGLAAPPAALAAIRHGIELGFAAGMAKERATFLHLRATMEAAALRHLFFAERAAHGPGDLRHVAARPIARVGVVGGGTMGVGIAAALRNAGLLVTLSERDETALSRGLANLGEIFGSAAKRGLATAAEAAERLAGTKGVVGLEALEECDFVIEAVFEDLSVKRDVFTALGRICRPDAILATNTSYIDPREIAQSLDSPGRFLGLHFFSPAQVMKLLEIVPTPETTPETLATSFELGRRLGKVPVRSGICDGFIGNRILRRYRGEAEFLVRQGLSVATIDSAMRAFGFPMGPFEVQDLSGLDISYMHREAARARGEDLPIQLGDLLVRAGRKGQKTGAGWYDYTPGDRRPTPSDEAARIIAPLVHSHIELSPETIADRLVGAMAAEGETILSEGIAASPADIDLVEIHGYGFPRAKGGPMFLAARKVSHS